MNVENILIESLEYMPTSTGRDRWILNGEITVWSKTAANELGLKMKQSLAMNIDRDKDFPTFRGLPNAAPVAKTPYSAPASPYQSKARASASSSNWKDSGENQKSIERQCALKEARALISQLVTDKFIGTADLKVLVGMIDSVTNDFEKILNRQPPVLKEPEKQ